MAIDLEKIQSLIKFVAKSGVSEVEFETKDFKINIKTGPTAEAQTVFVPANAQPQNVNTPVAPQIAAAPAQQAPAPPVAANDSKYVIVKSPMIGTFYRSPGPDKPAFINVGDKITPGKVLCIIEAMKLFNEIESDISGTIVKVLTDDSKPVEYDQPLFLVDPS